MTIETIINLISSVGFPIVACVALFVMNNKQTERHNEEMSKITESLNNNTNAITRLSEKLEGINNG